MASFDTVMGQMTKMSQRKKKRSLSVSLGLRNPAPDSLTWVPTYFNSQNATGVDFQIKGVCRGQEKLPTEKLKRESAWQQTNLNLRGGAIGFGRRRDVGRSAEVHVQKLVVVQVVEVLPAFVLAQHLVHVADVVDAGRVRRVALVHQGGAKAHLVHDGTGDRVGRGAVPGRAAVHHGGRSPAQLVLAHLAVRGQVFHVERQDLLRSAVAGEEVGAGRLAETLLLPPAQNDVGRISDRALDRGVHRRVVCHFAASVRRRSLFRFFIFFFFEPNRSAHAQ